MRLFVFLMIPLLVSCLVEEGDPEANNTKAFKPKPPPEKKHDWEDDYFFWRFLVIKSHDNDHSQIVSVAVNLDKDIGKIQAFKKNNKGEFLPTEDNCADQYDKNMLYEKYVGPTDWQEGASGGEVRRWKKNGKSLDITVYKYRDIKIDTVGFGVPYDEKQTINYHSDRDLSLELSSGLSNEVKDQLLVTTLKADDCIEGSPSGEPTDRPFGG